MLRWAVRGGLRGGDESLSLLQSALYLSAHVLSRDKAQLAGQLRGRLLSSPETELQALAERAGQWQGALWLCPLAPCLEPPGGPLLRSLEGHLAGVRAAAITPDGTRVKAIAPQSTP
jgi:hypothetical protein